MQSGGEADSRHPRSDHNACSCDGTEVNRILGRLFNSPVENNSRGCRKLKSAAADPEDHHSWGAKQCKDDMGASC